MFEPVQDLLVGSMEFELLRTRRAGRSTELYASCLTLRQSLARSCRDEVSLDLSGKSEGEGENLGVDVVAKHDAFFDCNDVNPAIDELLDRVQHIQKPATYSARLTDYESVTSLKVIEHVAELAFGEGALVARDSLSDDLSDLKVLPSRVLFDTDQLIVGLLLLGTDADVGDDSTHLLGVRCFYPISLRAHRVFQLSNGHRQPASPQCH